MYCVCIVVYLCVYCHVFVYVLSCTLDRTHEFEVFLSTSQLWRLGSVTLKIRCSHLPSYQEEAFTEQVKSIVVPFLYIHTLVIMCVCGNFIVMYY